MMKRHLATNCPISEKVSSPIIAMSATLTPQQAKRATEIKKKIKDLQKRLAQTLHGTGK